MEHLEFNQQIWLALIVGGLTIFASLITGMITFLTAARLRDAERNKRSLIRAYRDIAAFHRLEKYYTEELARICVSVSAESWKKQIRRNLREHHPTPSDKATAHYAETRVEELC